MQSTRSTLRDFRLIDCTSRAIVPASSDCLFVTLSYVWGASAVAADVVIGLLVGNLPRTIEDSISVTNTFGSTNS